MVLGCHAVEVGRARRAVRNNLRERPARIVDLVEQCVSETVANAVVHSGSEIIVLVVVELPGRVRVEVVDGGATVSVPRVAGESGWEAESGRGLFLVDVLTDAWGTHADQAGRTVWFEVGTG